MGLDLIYIGLVIGFLLVTTWLLAIGLGRL
jgi:hypothetical protein